MDKVQMRALLVLLRCAVTIIEHAPGESRRYPTYGDDAWFRLGGPCLDGRFLSLEISLDFQAGIATGPYSPPKLCSPRQLDGRDLHCRIAQAPATEQRDHAKPCRN